MGIYQGKRVLLKYANELCCVKCRAVVVEHDSARGHNSKVFQP